MTRNDILNLKLQPFHPLEGIISSYDFFFDGNVTSSYKLPKEMNTAIFPDGKILKYTFYNGEEANILLFETRKSEPTYKVKHDMSSVNFIKIVSKGLFIMTDFASTQLWNDKLQLFKTLPINTRYGLIDVFPDGRIGIVKEYNFNIYSPEGELLNEFKVLSNLYHLLKVISPTKILLSPQSPFSAIETVIYDLEHSKAIALEKATNVGPVNFLSNGNIYSVCLSGIRIWNQEGEIIFEYENDREYTRINVISLNVEEFCIIFTDNDSPSFLKLYKNNEFVRQYNLWSRAIDIVELLPNNDLVILERGQPFEIMDLNNFTSRMCKERIYDNVYITEIGIVLNTQDGEIKYLN